MQHLGPRYPGLDGLRAVSIMMVLCLHWTQTSGIEVPQILLATIFNGMAGVHIFFVVSGFLITRLVAMASIAGTFSYSDFYKKRFAKLVPVLLLYCLAVLIFNYWSGQPIRWLDYFRAMTFLTGHHSMMKTASFGHTWSLSVEEFFYVGLVPFIYLFGKRIDLQSKFLTIVIVLSVSSRYANIFLSNIPITIFGHQLSFIPVISEMAPIAIGCLLAIHVEEAQNHFKDRMSRSPRLFTSIAFLMLSVALISPLNGGLKSNLLESIGIVIESIGACVLILQALTNNYPSLIQRFLNCGLFVEVGLASYSIYVFQQVLFWPPPGYMYRPEFVIYGSVPIALLAGMILFRLIEQPLNRYFRKVLL